MKEAIKIVIIEDELLTSNDLKSILLKINNSIEVTAQLQSVAEAFEYFAEPQEFDLIFSDIKLGDGLSFEVFEAFPIQQPVIFCTAYNDYAVEAFGANGIDYILKPFDTEMVVLALNKYRTSHQNQSSFYQNFAGLLEDMNLGKEKGAKRILVEKGRRSIPMRIDGFAVVYIEDRIVFAMTFDGSKHMLSGTLESIHERFGGRFFRVNRKYLVHKKAVIEAVHTTSRKLRLNLKVKLSEEVIVGKMKASEFLQWLVV
ncbi:MAG: LytTR family DNA-binding domain-containing protein [Bacteroidota bacterium]